MTRYLKLFALACLTGMACDTLLVIDVPYSAETTIQEGTVIEDVVGEIGFGDLLNLDVTSSTELENQGVEPGDISQVALTFFRLEVREPAGEDLSFLQSMELYVESPGLDRVLVASSDDFPAGATAVDFSVEEIDLTDYVVSQSLTLSTEVSGRRPDVDMNVVASLNLRVGVTGQGACRAISASEGD